MKLRYILFHILMCLALAFVVPSCVDPVEDPDEIVDEEGEDTDGEDGENEDEEPVLDPEEAAKYVSESAYKVAQYVKKNYPSTKSVADIETITDWLRNQDYVKKIVLSPENDFHITFKDGTEFYIVTRIVSTCDEDDSTETIKVRSSSPNVYDVSSFSSEIIQDNNKFLYIEGIPGDFRLLYEIVDTDILPYSPLNIDFTLASGANDYIRNDLNDYGAILIGKTHGTGRGSFMLKAGVFEWIPYYFINAVCSTYDINQKYSYVDSVIISLKEIYSQVSSNPFIYANYCWSAEFNHDIKGVFVGYIGKSSSKKNVKLSTQYFDLLLNGSSHFSASKTLEAYDWTETFTLKDYHTQPEAINQDEDGMINMRYFSIRTDKPELTDDSRLIITGQFKGYKNLKPEVSYKIYYKEGSLFSSPYESGVESITLNKYDIGSDGTIQIDITDNLKMNQYYAISLGFEYNGNCYIGNRWFFTTPLRVTPGKWVDLGLSVKWAGWNVGASSPEEYGGYYAWGETSTKSDYTFENYKHRERTDYDHEHSGDDCCWYYKFIGNEISGTSYDVAHVQWGGGARMPTLAEVQELVDNCTFTGGSYNGVRGSYVIGPNGNSIFLPFAGDRDSDGLSGEGNHGNFWSGTYCDFDRRIAYDLYCYGDNGSRYFGTRYGGQSVRPVRDK